MLLDDHNCIKYFNIEELGIKYVAIKELENYRKMSFNRKELRTKSEAKDTHKPLEYDESVSMES